MKIPLVIVIVMVSFLSLSAQSTVAEFYIVKRSPNQQLAAGAAYNRDIPEFHLRLWNAQNGETIMDLQGHTAPVLDFAWSPDSNRLVASDGNFDVIVWCTDVTSATCDFGEEIYRFDNFVDSAVVALDWNDDDLLVTASGYGGYTLQIWDMVTYGFVSGRRAGDVTDVEWSPDGNQLAVAGFYGGVYVLNSDLSVSTQPLENYRINSASEIPITAVVWDNTGSRLAYGMQSGEIVVTNTTTYQEINRLDEYNSPVFALAWSPDNTQLATADSIGMVILWNPTTDVSQIVSSIEKETTATYSIEWNFDGTLLYPDNTGFPVGLPTPIPTSTPIPPTATHTNTPIPPTLTPTNTPIPPLSANAGYDQNHRIPHDGQILGPIYASVTLNGSASTGQILAYEWSRGGNVFSTQAVVNLQLVPGTYVFTLKVSDANDEDTDTVTINVTTCLFAPPSCGGTTENE